MRKLALTIALLSAPALAAVMAVLQSQSQVTTPGGSLAVQCVYQVPGGKRFVQTVPLGSMCPPYVMVD